MIFLHLIKKIVLFRETSDIIRLIYWLLVVFKIVGSFFHKAKSSFNCLFLFAFVFQIFKIEFPKMLKIDFTDEMVRE